MRDATFSSSGEGLAGSRLRALRLALLLGVVPTVVGGLIYVGYRSRDLLLFDWARSFGLLPLVEALRPVAGVVPLPPFAIHSLPAGFWAFGLSALLGVVWGRDSSRLAAIWHLVPFGVGVGSELLQALSLLPGTYDVLDLLSYSVGSFLGYFAVRLISHQNPWKTP